MNPFSSVFARGVNFQAGIASEPAEGGILMLHDLQESQATRAALVSAWRDYGPQARLASLSAQIKPPMSMRTYIPPPRRVTRNVVHGHACGVAGGA